MLLPLQWVLGATSPDPPLCAGGRSGAGCRGRGAGLAPLAGPDTDPGPAAPAGLRSDPGPADCRPCFLPVAVAAVLLENQPLLSDLFMLLLLVSFSFCENTQKPQLTAQRGMFTSKINCFVKTERQRGLGEPRGLPPPEHCPRRLAAALMCPVWMVLGGPGSGAPAHRCRWELTPSRDTPSTASRPPARAGF